MASPSQRLGHSVLDRPAPLESGVDRGPVEPGAASQLRGCELLPLELEGLRPAGVRGLFPPCGPPAILREVWAVVIDPVQCRARRAVSHVCMKRSDAASPLVADVDPSSSVVGVGRVVGVVAPLDHRHPCSPHAGVGEPVDQRAVMPSALGASFRLARVQVEYIHAGFGPAIAHGERVPAVSGVGACDGPSSIALLSEFHPSSIHEVN